MYNDVDSEATTIIYNNEQNINQSYFFSLFSFYSYSLFKNR